MRYNNKIKNQLKMEHIIFHINVFHEKVDDSITWALNVARTFNKKAFFLHIVDPRDEGWYPPHADSQSFIGDMTTEQLRDKEMKTAKDNIDKKLSKYLSLMKNPPVADFKAEQAMTENALIEYSAKKDTYFISVDRTTQKNSVNLYHQFQHFIKESQCPILLVNEMKPTSVLKNIVYVTDFKAQDVPVMQSLKKMSQVLGATLQAYHVDSSKTFQDKAEDLKRREDKFVNADFADVVHEVRNIKKESMTEAVQEIQENEKPDLIVLLKENRNFWQKLFEKNQSRKIIIDSSIPVMIFHEKSKDFARVGT